MCLKGDVYMKSKMKSMFEFVLDNSKRGEVGFTTVLVSWHSDVGDIYYSIDIRRIDERRVLTSSRIWLSVEEMRSLKSFFDNGNVKSSELVYLDDVFYVGSDGTETKIEAVQFQSSTLGPPRVYIGRKTGDNFDFQFGDGISLDAIENMWSFLAANEI